MKSLEITKLESLIFDLDGTLWDTCPSCAIGWNNVISRNQIDFREILPDDVRSVAGKPHDECIRSIFKGLPEDKMQLLIDETMIEDNEMVKKYGGELYPFVSDGLELLSSKFRIFIVSNCQSGYIELFLKFANLQNLVSDFECYGNTRLSKGDNIKLLMQRNSISSGIYIGDTSGDQNAAKEANMPFAFVTYGFGTCEGHDLEFQSFSDLTKNLFDTEKQSIL